MGDQRLPENQLPRLPRHKSVSKHKTEQQISTPFMEDHHQQVSEKELDDFPTDYEPHEENLPQTIQGTVFPQISSKVSSTTSKMSQRKLPKDLGSFSSISMGQQGIRRQQYKLDHFSQVKDDAEDYSINLKEQQKCDQILNKWPHFKNQMKSNKNSKHGKKFHNLRPPENSRLGQKNFLPTHISRNKNLLEPLNYRCSQRGGDNIHEWNEALENSNVLQQFDMDCDNPPTYDEFSDKIITHLPSKYFRGLTKENGIKLCKKISKFDMEVQKPHDLSTSTKEKFKHGPSYQNLKQLKTQAIKEPLNDPKSLPEIEDKNASKPDVFENLYGPIAFKDFIVNKGYNMPGILQKLFMKKGWDYNSVTTPIPSVLKYHEMNLRKMDDEDDENSGKELD